MSKLFLTLISVVCVIAWSCGGGEKSADGEGKQGADQQMVKSGRAMKLENKGFASPESVIGDGTHYYVSNVGKKLEPFEEDGDGFIMKLDGAGEVVAEKFIEKLNAPKGMAISGGKLYVTDINKIKAFDLATGAAAGEIDFTSKGTSFLNDLAIKSSNELFVSATDINKIYSVNLEDNSITEIIAKPTPQKPNGLWYDADAKTLYVAGYSAADPLDGKVGVIKISNKGNTYEDLNQLAGNFDGITLLGNMVIFSDWNRQSLLILDQSAGKLGGFPLPNSVSGPADFYYDAKVGEFWIPGMQENAVYIQSL